jgi:hypothetical protein
MLLVLSEIMLAVTHPGELGFPENFTQIPEHLKLIYHIGPQSQ